MNSFQTSHAGPFGEIQSSWKREGKQVIYKVVIPANSTAKLKLSGKKISRNGKVGYTKTQEIENNPFLMNLESGSYEFVINQ